MKNLKASKTAYIPPGIFLINLTIYLLIEVFGIVYTYSSVAKKIYLFFCLPLNILGGVISMYLLMKFLIYRKNTWNIILCLPLLIFIFYFYFVPLLRSD